MPTIVKLQKKQKTSSGRTETDIRKLRQTAYQNTAWRKERDNYLREHPLCEKCLEKGKITPAQDIHHKKSPFKNGEINWNLLYDVNNLMSLCKECHGNIHAAQQGHISAEEVLKQLDDLFNENIKDEDLE
jgi:5-methylcytosine-specific restriction protein A